MQARRRGCDRATRLREDGLVAVVVVLAVRSLDIRRQRNVTSRVDHLLDGRTPVGPEAHHTTTERSSIENLAAQRVCGIEEHARTWLEFLPRADQRLPQFAAIDGIALTRDKQTLDAATTGIAVAEQPRRNDARVVDDEQVTRAQLLRQGCDGMVGCLAGGTIETQQARRPANSGRLLRDQIIGEFEIEVADEHVPHRTGSRPPLTITARRGNGKSAVLAERPRRSCGGRPHPLGEVPCRTQRAGGARRARALP